MKSALIVLAGILLATSASGQWLWCEEMDEVYAVVDGSTITVHHRATLYNCCPDAFDYAVERQGNLIEVDEHEILTVPCLCLCCYNLAVDIADVAAGQYQLDFGWYDYEHGQWETRILDVTVPDVGQGGDVTIAEVFASPCLEQGAIRRNSGHTLSTWGAIKAIYE